MPEGRELPEPGASASGSFYFSGTAFRPLILLAALFAAELIPLSIRLDGESLSRHVPLLALMSHYGAWILRGVVGFAVVFVTFAFLRYGVVPGAVKEGQWGGVRLGWLGGHGLAMAGFAGLSWLLYSPRLAVAQANAVAVAWLVTGMAGIVLAALAFVPGRAWAAAVRDTGYLWLQALLAAVAVAMAGGLARSAWAPLTQLTFQLVRALLGVFVSGIVAEPAKAILGTAKFQVEVAPECSGFEGMALIVGFGVVWLTLFRKECRFPQALLLLPAGVLFIYALNIVRITALVLIGNAGAAEIAEGGFHSQAGWIAFAAASLCFSFAARRVPWIAVRGARAEVAGRGMERQGTNPTTAYLLPFLAILAAGMLSAAMTGKFEWMYGLRLVAAAACLWRFRDSYRGLDWRCGWRGVAGGIGLFFVWVGMDRWSGVGGSAAMPVALAGAAAGVRLGWIAVRVLAAVVTVPVAEELAFRGFVMRRVGAEDFEAVAMGAAPWVGVAVSSVLFGLMHGPRWPAGIVAGLLFGWLAKGTGRIGEAVVAHGVTNALIAVYALGFGQWQLW